MIVKAFYSIISATTIFICFYSNIYAFEDKRTHPDITNIAVEKSMLDKYLKDDLSLKDGIQTKMPSNSSYDISFLLRQGSTDEDSPACRASNHFHDPLKAWGQSAVTDMPATFAASCYLSHFMPRYSNITWATGYKTSPPNGEKTTFPLTWAPNNWDQARKYYLGALTYVAKTDREAAFAKTFQAIGQVMHLLEDMAVPAHVRNDFQSHLYVTDPFSSFNPIKWVNNRFERYIQGHPELVSTLSTASTITPIFNNVKTTDFWDTTELGNSNYPLNGNDIGLAEFTNANYLSDLTIPGNSPTQNHTYTYPRIGNGSTEICAEYVSVLTNHVRYYVSRIPCPSQSPANNGTVDHFSRVSMLSDVDFFESGMSSSTKYWLDDNVHIMYAGELLPRAVGYSAGLLNYFFRGDINLEPSTTDPSKFVIKNNSNEDMAGKFEIYYDNSNNERSLLLGFDAMAISAHNKSMLITLNEPKDPSAYILVFKGRMGNEEGAVAGRVVKYSPLTISAPDRCLYGLADGARLPQQFNKINAKVKSSFTPDQAVQSGTLWAVAKYKRRMDYQPDLSTDPPSPGVIDPVFAYSVSAPKTITTADLEAMNSTKEFAFDFSGSPIPAGITDLYLKIVFRGNDGTQQDVIAMGWKDLGEPMHHVYWNATDAFYIEGKMYDKIAIEANQYLLDRARASGFPYVPLSLDTDIAYCPSMDGVSKTHVEYAAMPAGTFGRVITITGADQQEFDVAIHRKSTNPPEEMASLFTTPTAINQTNQNGVLQIFPVSSFRGIASHAGSAFVNCYNSCPENILTLQWPKAPASMTPRPVTFIAQ